MRARNLLLAAGLFFFCSLQVSWSQSTLEYAALLTKTAGDGVNKKAKGNQTMEGSGGGLISGVDVVNQAEQSMYAGTSAALSRGAAMMEGVGKAPAAAGAPEAAPKRDIEKTEPPAEKTKPSDAALDKIYLKSGKVIEGRITEKGDGFLKVDIDGTPVTFFNDEIDKVG